MDLTELGIEVGKQFLIIAFAIWVLVFALYKIPSLEDKFPKELMAFIIGVIVAIIGRLTGFFEGHIIAVIGSTIVAIFVSQIAYDKVKTIFNQYGMRIRNQ